MSLNDYFSSPTLVGSINEYVASTDYAYLPQLSVRVRHDRVVNETCTVLGIFTRHALFKPR